ncbi:hypothetical protein DM02DRAFT_251027 [Periconia macrospinosa]|uniref:Uncharacterized protein n=1 Tax=Periconia macrospinosa TaxID=97972 RepID=A0A2V1E1A9_9PLEO|nr:hypothetical protein DM02DRAFT_251027 [Periconia macrospinosa]
MGTVNAHIFGHVKRWNMIKSSKRCPGSSYRKYIASPTRHSQPCATTQALLPGHYSDHIYRPWGMKKSLFLPPFFFFFFFVCSPDSASGRWYRGRFGKISFEKQKKAFHAYVVIPFCFLLFFFPPRFQFLLFFSIDLSPAVFSFSFSVAIAVFPTRDTPFSNTYIYQTSQYKKHIDTPFKQIQTQLSNKKT